MARHITAPAGRKTGRKRPGWRRHARTGCGGWRVAVVASGVALLGACAHDTSSLHAVQDPLSSYVKARLAEKLADPRAGELFYAITKAGVMDERVRQSALFQLILEGRLEKARTVARQMRLSGDRTDLPALIATLEQLRRGDGRAALAELETLAPKGFSQVIRPVLTAWARALAGDRDAALQALRPLENRYGLKAYAKMERALLLDFLGEQERAATAYKALVYRRGLPSLEPLVSYLALLRRSGRETEATTVLADMRKAFPANAVLADVARRIANGMPLPARAATPRGAVAVILLELAEEIAREDLLRPAIIYARLAQWLAPDYDEATVRLVDLLSRADYHDLARTEARRVAHDSPWWGAAQRAAALAQRRAGDMAGAIATLKGYLARYPEDIDSWVLFGDLLRLAERYEEAINAYSRAIARMQERQLQPGWYPFFARGVAFERKGDWPHAEADFLTALKKKPDEADVLNYLGYSWLDRGMRIDEAITLIERAAALKPDDGAIVDSLGWAYYVRGEIDKAVETLERAVLLMPNDPTINEHLGDAYWRAGRYREARFQWAHALAFHPEPERRTALERKLRLGLVGGSARTASTEQPNS
ncbi:MAG: tetratricopeptide repeat protein [Alphaproteobacteria bacterium]|nr:MAG: tetratricopeptide repeat protein [Alphaproteobacteria bacterium]